MTDGLLVTGLVADYGSTRAVSGVDLEIGRSEFVTLLGPSGCGKTTTLRCVAGLHTPRSGEITLGGKQLYGPGVNAPPHKRDINMVFQSYAVWPHMTTRENVAYGLKAKKMARATARAKAEEMLELVGLAEFADRHATDLSGGQQQRVALARALATEPSLVLMDEPLSNLDAQLRARMRDEIRQIQRRTGITVLYVTHDQSEALSMSDRVVVMNRGTIQQVGDPWALYHRPENAFVATFVGDANVVPGEVTEVGDHASRCGSPAWTLFSTSPVPRRPTVPRPVTRSPSYSARSGLRCRKRTVQRLGTNCGPASCRVSSSATTSSAPMRKGSTGCVCRRSPARRPSHPSSAPSRLW